MISLYNNRKGFKLRFGNDFLTNKKGSDSRRTSAMLELKGFSSMYCDIIILRNYRPSLVLVKHFREFKKMV